MGSSQPLQVCVSGGGGSVWVVKSGGVVGEGGGGCVMCGEDGFFTKRFPLEKKPAVKLL